MFDMNEILARLQNGEDVEAIAEEFTTALNSAVKERDLQEEKNKKAELEAKEKRDTLQEALDLLLDWIDEYYPKFGTEHVNLDAAEIIKALDEGYDDIVELIEAVKALQETIVPNEKETTCGCGKAHKRTPLDLDAILSAFFEANDI